MIMNLFLFHTLPEDPVIESLLRFRETGGEEDYFRVARALIAFAKTRETRGNIVKEYIIKQILESENLPYILELRDFLRQDIKTIFYQLLEVDWDGLFRDRELLPLSGILIHDQPPGAATEYVRSMEMMMDCSSNEALVGALLAHVESFS